MSQGRLMRQQLGDTLYTCMTEAVLGTRDVIVRALVVQNTRETAEVPVICCLM